MKLYSPRKVGVSSADVRRFNFAWPCSKLRASRGYWFEFDESGDLIDTDCPESDDGPESAAMAEDCKAWLEDDTLPDWAELEASETAAEPQQEGKRLVELIASHLDAMGRTREGWQDYHRDAIQALVSEHMPSGSGFDAGTELELEESRPDRLCFKTSFHHMDGESGMYSGWTEHRVIAAPSFVFGLDLKVTGRDRNGIKDYIAETFQHVLCSIVREPGSTA